MLYVGANLSSGKNLSSHLSFDLPLLRF